MRKNWGIVPEDSKRSEGYRIQDAGCKAASTRRGSVFNLSVYWGIMLNNTKVLNGALLLAFIFYPVLGSAQNTGADEILDLAIAGDTAIIVARIDSVQDVNLAQTDGTSLLHWAVYYDDQALVDTLVERGADVTVRNEYGATPLSQAAIIGNPDVLSVLLEAGADLEARETKWGGTPMGWSSALNLPQMAAHLACFTRDVRPLARQGLLTELDDLLSAEPELANWRGDHPNEMKAPTALFCLPDDEDRAAEIARVLLAHGADPRVTNGEGKTAEQYARLRGLDEAADLMQEAIDAR